MFFRNISVWTWLVSLFLIALGIYYMVFGIMWGGLFTALGLLVIATGQDVIRPNPPEVGLLTVWNVRIPAIIREGNKLLPKMFPFLVNFIRVPVKRQVHEYSFEIEARNRVTKTDGSPPDFIPAGKMQIDLSVIGAPDYRSTNAGRRIMQYLQSGGEQGVDNILKQMLDSTTRTIALTYPWNEFMSMKAALQVALMTKIAESKLRTLPRNEDGTIPESAFDMSDAEYLRRPAITDPFEYLDAIALNDPAEFRRRTRELEFFLKVAQRNGGGDVHHIGFLMQQVNVKGIIPLGDLANSLDEPAREDIENVSDKKDVNTALELAQMILDRARAAGDTTMTFEMAMRHAARERGRLKEEVVRVESTGNPLMDAAAINRRS